MVMILKMRRKVLIWISLIFISILILVLGYIYAYEIFPENLMRLGMERLSNIAKEGYGLSRNFSLDNILKITLIILANNAIVNVLFALPFLGPISYLYVITFTGAVLRFYIDYIGTHIGKSFNSEAIMLLLITPHTYVELLAYAITLTESILISISIVKANISKRITLNYLIMIGLSYVVLFVAALIEALTMFLINP